MTGLVPTIAIAAAVLMDLSLGDPPNRYHPVAWMGSLIAKARDGCGGRSPALRFACGCGIVIFGSLLFGLTGWAIESLSQWAVRSATTLVPWVWGAVVLLHAVVLKCCFSIRSLHAAAVSVLENLNNQDVPAARRQLAYHLVSRKVEHLTTSEVSAATIESVAENASDSVVAPLLFYAVAGLPGALVYRFVNTCDAMLGYRTEQLEWLGKPAARVDDVFNLIPARITALLMIAASIPPLNAMARALQTWIREAGRTASPNAGHPMSAAAGSLSVCLEKTDHYCLGGEFRPPSVSDIPHMMKLFRRTVLLAVLFACLASYVVETLTAGSTP